MQQAPKARGPAPIVTGSTPKGADALSTGMATKAKRPRHRDGPTRQCAVCRKAQRTWALLQLAADLPEQAHAKRRGRRTYVCIALACLQGLGPKVLSRALRRQVQPDTAAIEPQAIAQMAADKVMGLLGLARRQNAIVLGAGRLSETDPQSLRVVVISEDVAQRTQRQLEQQGHAVTQTPFASAEDLGASVGAAPLAALGIRSGRLGSQAAYWLRVWYEAQAHRPKAGMQAAAIAGEVEAQPVKQVDDTSGTDEYQTGRRIEVAR